jgi:hypothetical protein
VLELTSSPVRHTGTEGIGVATDQMRSLQVRHCGGGFQRVYLAVRRPTLIRLSESSPRCRYPELRELELKQLARTLSSKDSNLALHTLKDKIKAYTRGQLPRAKDILPALYELLDSDGMFEETPPQLFPAPKHGIPGGGWEALKDALAQSLTSGSFLDSQFYALDSKRAGAPTIRPIYFCSMAGGTFLPKLIKCGFSALGLQEHY